MAPDAQAARCPGCAATVASGAVWCGLCFSPIPVASAFTPASVATPGDESAGFRPGGPTVTRAKIYTDSRWKSGSLTFGPLGRVILTICFCLPYAMFYFSLPFGLAGAVIWTGLLPRAMRDIWQTSRRHHLPPQD